jgi:hypothetical protein
MNRRSACGVTTAACLLLFAWISLAAAEEKSKPMRPQADASTLIRELGAVKLIGDDQVVAFWVPFEFFVEVSLKPDGSDRADAERGLDFMKKYQIVVAGIGTHDKSGGVQYVSEKDIRRTVSLKLASGAEFPLIDDVPERVANAVAIFRALFAKNMGEFGNNLQVLVFSSTAKDGKTVLTVSGQKTVVVQFKDIKGMKPIRLEWKTPLDSLNPIPPCARCKESLSAKWSYCPWCGAKIPRKSGD